MGERSRKCWNLDAIHVGDADEPVVVEDVGREGETEGDDLLARRFCLRHQSDVGACRRWRRGWTLSYIQCNAEMVQDLVHVRFPMVRSVSGE
jgi:hypothetical protein